MSVQGVDREELQSIKGWVHHLIDELYREITADDTEPEQELKVKFESFKTRIVADEKEGCVTILPTNNAVQLAE